MVNLINRHIKERLTKSLSIILLGLALVSCSDTDGPPEDLVGTAATGAAISGTVYAMDAMGVEISKTINADGYFRMDVRGMTAPFILKAVADNGGADLFSYASGTDVTVNITPLTNLAMYLANGEADPAPLYDSWASSYVNIAAADITNAQAVINANLSTQYTAFSLDPFTYDFIGARFLANGTSIDSLLDKMTVDISAGVSLSVTGVTMPLFDPFVSIVDYDIGGDSVAISGAYTLSMNVSVDGGTTSSNLILSINLPASAVPTVPTANIQFVEDMFSTFYGSVGSIVFSTPTSVTADVDTPTTIIAVIDATITPVGATDLNYLATYTYTLNP